MKKNILVTGAHRSGTTWTGKIISSASHVRYVQEPFNVAIKRYKSPFKSNYEYIAHNSPSQKQKAARSYLLSFISKNPLGQIGHILSAQTLKGTYYTLGDTFNRWTHRTLFKDPLALFSAEWMAKELNCDVVVLVRHPAAFVASLKVKHWEYNFKNLKRQPDLIEDHLNDYASEIEAYATDKKDIVSQGILIWNILYHMVHSYQNKKEKNWCFVRHEDLSRNPVAVFRDIFEFLSLDFSGEVEKNIITTTTASSATKKLRNAKENISTWKSRLSEKEIAQIKEGTKKIWPHFYGESDW